MYRIVWKDGSVSVLDRQGVFSKIALARKRGILGRIRRIDLSDKNARAGWRNVTAEFLAA